MMSSSSTAMLQSCSDGERRGEEGWAAVRGARISHKRQLRITRNFAYYAKEKSSAGSREQVEPCLFIAHNRKFCAQTIISYKKRLGRPSGRVIFSVIANGCKCQATTFSLKLDISIA